MTKARVIIKEHEILWATLEKIAKDRKKSMSALATSIGLDPTAFGKSKRVENGVYRMPTMTTILALLRVHNISWYDWANIWYKIEKQY